MSQTGSSSPWSAFFVIEVSFRSATRCLSTGSCCPRWFTCISSPDFKFKDLLLGPWFQNRYLIWLLTTLPVVCCYLAIMSAIASGRTTLIICIQQKPRLSICAVQYLAVSTAQVRLHSARALPVAGCIRHDQMPCLNLGYPLFSHPAWRTYVNIGGHILPWIVRGHFGSVAGAKRYPSMIF